jgi:AraC family transcriptional regulator, regulatory protein of adaptative response / methylated-DNA-[protein]-cysteine methyltransferase
MSFFNIGYIIEDSKFGRTLVAAIPQGICAVLFGKDDVKLIEEAKELFPNYYKLVEITDAINIFNIKIIVSRFINNHNTDMHQGVCTTFCNGTHFQKKVWNALLDFPTAGKTITYSKLAEYIGHPKAHRAVASAVGKNPVSILVPCHRVVPKNGGIGKYRWGTAMKQQLLNREQGL